MVFSSLLFLFWFIPVFFTIYYLVPAKIKNPVLFLGSIVFYGWGEPKYLILLLVSITVNWLAGLLIGRFRGRGDKAVLICAIVFDLAMLFFFKYINFFIENINNFTGTSLGKVNITLPLGISFYPVI